MKVKLTTALFLLMTTLLQAQEQQFDSKRKYHPDSLKMWTSNIMDGISEKHPGFYRYTSKESFKSIIDSTKNTINDSLSELDYYRKLKPLFAKIGCLHTGVHLSKEYTNYLNETTTLIPLDVFLDPEKKVLISKNYDLASDIPIGGEIVSINGKPISWIINRLLKSISSDGYNETEKILLLNHRFPFWYQTIIEVTDSFEVEIRNGENVKKYALKGVKKEALPSLESLENNYQKPLEFKIVDGIGLLKVHSFAKTTIKEYEQNFKKYIKNTFERIQNENIETLVLDLRYNTGGTDGNAALLASYFFDEQFRYWDKIEVTEAIANDVKGFDRLFYKKPIKVNGSYHWRKTWITKEFDYYETQKPAKNNFKGKTYIITNGLCLSSCSDFVAVLAHNNKAEIIGQETGGGYQGNTSGMMPTVKIYTGLQVTIPLQKYTNAVDLTKNFGHGTKPDYELTTTFEDWIDSKDVEIEYTLKLIKEDKESTTSR